jgi:Uma2 family endonuclease
MRSMSLTTADEIVEAVEHLPSGATLIVDQVGWDEYECLLESLAERPGLRVTYDSGVLEIMTVSPRHGRAQGLIFRLVLVCCEVLGLRTEAFGVTTWKRKSLLKGIEPDDCFYIKNVEHVIGKEDFDEESDPTPDLAIEVEVTRSSLKKLSIYAALGVSEVWRYNGKICRFYGLSEGEYVEIQSSNCLSGLTPQLIAETIELSKTVGQDEACKVFRRKIQDLVQAT